MEQVLGWGVTTLNLDSISQLRLCCEVFLFRAKTQRSKDAKLDIGLRLNVSEDSRIGVSSADFDEAVSIASAAGLKVTGLHFYRGTGTNATTAFIDVIDAILAIAKKLPDWQYLDFGGGFGYPYHHDGVAFDWEIFGNKLSTRIKKILFGSAKKLFLNNSDNEEDYKPLELIQKLKLEKQVVVFNDRPHQRIL
jgi:diaminopimelate decarboxylase